MKNKSSSTVVSLFQKLYKSIWLFPAFGFLMLLVLTSLKISGSSIGQYNKDLYGGKTKDKSLIIGQSRSIRSDEWEFQTLMAAAQAKAGFPKINKNIGDGQDMEIIADVPYKDWSVIFKPQNLAFFVLPFAFALAFKWWLLALLLIISVYFFILVLLPKKRLLAALISLCLFFSPFVQWWYQTITLAPIFYSFIIAIAVIKLWQSSSKQAQMFWMALLSYSLVGFAIIIYPPFQIPCAIVTASFLVGYFIEKGYLTNKKEFLRVVTLPIISVFVALIIILSFLVTNNSAIDALQNTIYPGKRIGTSGHYDAEVFFSNFLDSQLQLSRKSIHYVANQSEASNFILLSPFLSLPILFTLLTTFRKKRKVDWPLLLSTGLFLLFLVRLFVPGTNLLFRPLFLNSVPNNRLLIGIGLVSFLQLILFIRHLLVYKNRYPRIMAISLGVAVFIFNLLFAELTKKAHPGFISSTLIIVVLSAMPAIVVSLLFLRKIYAALLLLLLVSLMAAGMVNPLYRGTGVLINSKLTDTISSIDRAGQHHRWVVVDNLTYENLPAISNVRTITGIFSYPQIDLWKSSPITASSNIVYNRYAHTNVHFTNSPTQLVLKQPDYFVINSSPCAVYFREEDVKFFISNKNYSEKYSCLKLNSTVSYPNVNFYILERR